MNKHDRDNLNFLLHLDSDAFEQWYESVSQDDLDYAQEIMAQAALEMREEACALKVEVELAQMNRYALAEQVISLVK